MPMINFRVTEEEKISLQNNANKTSSTLTDYCKNLALSYQVENITSAQTINALIDLWQEMQQKNIDKNILEKLKQIILDCKL